MPNNFSTIKLFTVSIAPNLLQNMYKRNISLKYYFESPLLYKLCYYRQTIFNQLNIIVPYVEIIGLCLIVAIF